MNRRLVATVVTASALTFTVYILQGGTVAQQTAFLIDAGVTPTHVATCPVRISPECRNDALDAGVVLRTYERLSFGVAVKVMPDGGRDIQLPPIRQDARECIQPDWENCTLALCATRPTVCARVGQKIPFVLETRASRCLRKNTDAGFGACTLLDGGNPGEMNVRPVGAYAGNCQKVEAMGASCAVVAGEDPDTEL